MTPWIVDASVAISWFLTDEASAEYASGILRNLAERKIYVPALFVYEITNALTIAYRRNRMDVASLKQIPRKLAIYNLTIDPAEPNLFAQISTLALKHELTCYDAAYLDLGLRTGFPIATVDKALIRAMEAAGVERATPSIHPDPTQ